MSMTYDADMAAWAIEQAQLLRAGLFNQLDIEHLADEIEDLSKSEQRELASRMAVLLAHLLKWQFQSRLRGSSWKLTIQAQRKSIALVLKESPSLKNKFNDVEWMDVVWTKAIAQAASETGLTEFPEVCPWHLNEIFDQNFWPEAENL